MSSRRRSSLVAVHADKGRGEQEGSVPLSGMLILLLVLAGIAAIWINEFVVNEDNGRETTLYRLKANKKPESRKLHPFIGAEATLLNDCECDKVVTDALHYYIEKRTRDDDDCDEESSKLKKERTGKSAKVVKAEELKKSAFDEPVPAPSPTKKLEVKEEAVKKEAKGKEAKAKAIKGAAPVLDEKSKKILAASVTSSPPPRLPAPKVAVKIKSEKIEEVSDSGIEDTVEDGNAESDSNKDGGQTEESTEEDDSDYEESISREPVQNEYDDSDVSEEQDGSIEKFDKRSAEGDDESYVVDESTAESDENDEVSEEASSAQSDEETESESDYEKSESGDATVKDDGSEEENTMGAEQESAEASGAGDDEEESQEEKESSQEGGEIKSVESVEDEGSEEESEEEIAESGTEGEKRYEEASGEVSEEDEGAKSSEEQEEMEVSSQKDGSDELGSEETNEEQEEEFEESASEEASGEVEEETGEVQSEEGPQENIEEEEDEASEEVSEEEEASEESEEDAGASEGYEEDEEAYEAEESEEAEYEGSEEALADIIEESEVVKKMEEKSEQPKKVVKPAKDAKESKAMPPIPKLTLDGVRKRGHIADALGFASIGSDADRKEEKLIAQILKDIKKSATDSIKPMEKSFKFSDISQRVLGDAEIFNKPMALFLGPWSSGKSTAINYLLGTDDTRAALKTGPQPTDSFFSVIHYNENGIVRESGLKMAGDWAFSGVNKFGQAFLSHFRGIGLNHPLLEKVTIVDTPGVIDGRRFKDFPLEDVFQWFIDRADAIYVVFDPSKLEIGADMKAMLDQLRGKEQQTRFLLNKADLIKASEVTRVAGQLLWNVSPLLGSSDAPTIYTVSMINRPYLPGSPAEYLKDQEEEFLNHLKEVMDERVENTVMYARRHAVRVRNHAKLVDCYLDAFYKHKGMFGNKKKVAEQIIKDPGKYNIFDTISQSKNISRYDLLEPEDYAAFFKLNPLHEFSRLKDLCGFVKGCPIDKLDRLIAYDLPQLLSKYLEKSSIPHDSEEHETGRTKGTVKVPTNAKKIKSK